MKNRIALSHIFIDCKEPLRLQEFYHKLTGLEKRSMYNSPGLVVNQYGGKHWVTLFDPEGHPFCLGIDD